MAKRSKAKLSKSQLADKAEKILRELRRKYLSVLNPVPLPPIDPEAWMEMSWSKVLRSPSETDNEAAPGTGGGRLFPSRDELSGLDAAVAELAKAMKIKRLRYQDQRSVLKRLTHDYERLELHRFAVDLSNRVEDVPEPPLTKLAKLLAKAQNDADRLNIIELYSLLRGDPRLLGNDYSRNQKPPKVDWIKLAPLLSRLASASFTKLIPLQSELQSDARSRLAFRDVLLQQELWRISYATCLDPTVQWLHGLLDEEIDKSLRVPLHGLSSTPEQTKSNFRKYMEAKRKRKQRSRSKKTKNYPKFP